MQFDPENTVVKLCVEGMQLEAQGDIAGATKLFQNAWGAATNDFEAFTAAHYVARNQNRPEDALYWNKEALRRALAVGGDDMKNHFPSLYLNVAKAHETLGNMAAAASHYRLAAESSQWLPAASKYGEMIKMGITEGLKRTKATSLYNAVLEGLVNKWCEQKELKPLAIILPAYVGNLGTEDDRNKLISALHYLSATRCLNTADQLEVDALIKMMIPGEQNDSATQINSTCTDGIG